MISATRVAEAGLPGWPAEISLDAAISMLSSIRFLSRFIILKSLACGGNAAIHALPGTQLNPCPLLFYRRKSRRLYRLPEETKVIQIVVSHMSGRTDRLIFRRGVRP